jgi:16S rRNA U1498 N3-methylase RsmE
MRLHRFWSRTPITGDSVDISDSELIHQWKSVFRYNVGSQVILFDGDGHDYVCLISSLRTQGATLAVIQKMKGG